MGKPDQTFDVVIIGAGISGINAAYRLQESCPDRSYTILDARSDLGGTWDLFKYPGIRSDSDLHTFGFPFRPWMQKNAIADGHLIVEYMRDTAEEYGIDKHIQYQHAVESADFSTKRQRWTLNITHGEKPKTIRCQFLLFCTGYYDYHNPLDTKIPGISNFQGEVIHPQFWPENFDYANKNVVIIGSGATAVTLLPNLAKTASHVTMLQRSPSWIAAMPQNDAISRFFRRIMPERWAVRALRWRFLFLYFLSYTIFQRFPNLARNILRKRTAQLLPKDYPMDPNFNPSYNPWDQRLCMSPDGDFFAAIRDGSSDIVTGTITNITDSEIKVDQKGEELTLKPDVIITATGLKLQVAGGCKISIDGTPTTPASKFVYRHAMLQDIPNAVVFIGYVQYSWTLGSDVSARWACRLINHMARNGYESATPAVQGSMKEQPLLSLKSTYIQKGGSVLPLAGTREPWQPRKSYMHDLWEATRSDFRELEFRSAEGGYKDE
ncbi:monooxygenase flavin-binding family protein-like protein [Myriangium duriaei CBS 260.36]|uniref:Monooxygenase flavin-binding family protein-like protein n=1 Tax=Myriangium duriaei CBS 260.36 TaxID=1168546 RepID=A0A9P4JAW8_9PEZI|nr:monooxygenase flavin-binding family protein-like protein [Myriangium duriaei CBS 260.36]